MAVLYFNDFGQETIGVPPTNTTARWSSNNVTYSVIADAALTGGQAFRVVTTSLTETRLRSFDAADLSINIRLRARFRFTAPDPPAGSWARSVLRGSGAGTGDGGTETGYLVTVARVGPTDWFAVMERFENGAFTELDSIQIAAPVTGDIWNYRFEAADVAGQTLVRLWVWDDVDPEPATPTLSGTDSNPLPAGWAAVGQRQANSTIDYDFVTIETINVAAPVAVTGIPRVRGGGVIVP